MERITGDIGHQLPTEVFNQGWSLHWYQPQALDPVSLRDKKGKLLYEWEYIPSLTELFEVCREAGK